MTSIPYETMIINGAEALNKLWELQNDGGSTPVILGSKESAELLAENLEDVEQSVEQINAASAEIKFPQWFSDRVADDEEYYEQPHGEWPEVELTKMEITSHLDVLTGKPLNEVLIALIPTKESWKVPAYLKAGGWNECPLPEEHVALFKKWQDEYLIRVTCITGDVIEVAVERPPTQKDKAMELALEQFVYCPDIVHQGVETVENLASTLLNGGVWYFWWD